MAYHPKRQAYHLHNKAMNEKTLVLQPKFMVPTWLVGLVPWLPSVRIACKMLWYRRSALTGLPCSDPPSSCLAAMLCASCSNFSPLPLPLLKVSIPPKLSISKVPSPAHDLANSQSTSKVPCELLTIEQACRSADWFYNTGADIAF